MMTVVNTITIINLLRKTDEETKIQYIIVRFTSTAGAGVEICPRYTSSGNLYYVGSKIVE